MKKLLIGLVLAALAATAQGQTFQVNNLTASGLITPTSTIGIKGTVTNDSPATGSIGEGTSVGATAVATTSGAGTNIVSTSLPAGDYLIWGQGVTNPAGTTTTSGFNLGVSATSTGFNTVAGVVNVVSRNYPVTAGLNAAAQAPLWHVKFATTTTVYLVVQVSYAVSTLTTSGSLSWIRLR